MIINIPINLDEHIFEEKVQSEYDEIIKNTLIAKIENVLKESDQSWGAYKDSKRGLEHIIYNRIDEYIDEHSDEIVDAATKRLEERLARRKKIKEVAND